MKTMFRILLALLVSAQLAGCAALVVGGAVATGVAVHDRRSVGTVIDDNVLEVRVRNALFSDERFDQSTRIKVNAHNGWVLMAGEAGTPELVERATELASDVDGVLRLFNELAPLERVGFSQAGNDRLVSGRVTTSFTRIRDLPGFDPTRIKVTTTRGIVYLQGLVTEAEAEAAIEQARTVRGVERVITMFEFKNGSA